MCGAAFVLISAVALSGCSSSTKKLDPFAGKGSPYYSGKGALPKGGGRYHVGKPYQVAGRWFTPKEQPGYDKTGTASWYGEAFHRRKTSNGEWFNMNDLTAAHATLPLPSYAKVTNLENGREVVVRLNDRGPFVGPRIIDLSKRSAEVLGFKQNGKAQVRVQWIGVAPLSDDGNHLIAMNQALGRGEGVSGLRQIAKGKARIPDVQVADAKPRYDNSKLTELASAQSDISVKQSDGSNRQYFIQVASFTDAENAIATQDMLERISAANVVESTRNDEPIYRVQIGPLKSEVMALQVLDDVQEAGFFDAKVVSSKLQRASNTY
jgi:rare lipoprotein A